MSNQWFVIRNGSEEGPFTGSQLKSFVSSGQLVAAALIRRDDMKSPVQATSVKGLFQQLQATPKGPPPLRPALPPPLPKLDAFSSPKPPPLSSDVQPPALPQNNPWYKSYWVSGISFLIGMTILISGGVRGYQEVAQKTQTATPNPPSSYKPGGGNAAVPTSTDSGSLTLKVHVGTATEERNTSVENMNGLLSHVVARKTENSIELEFNFDMGGAWRTAGPYVLLVRLFDSNGNYLSHFVSAEQFRRYGQHYDVVYHMVNVRTHEIGAKLLRSGNHLSYPVNARDLQYVEAVEVGFVEVPQD